MSYSGKHFRGIDDPRVVEAVKAFEAAGGNRTHAAEMSGQSRTSLGRALAYYKKETKVAKAFDVEPLPDELPSAEELIERRKTEFDRKDKFEKSRHLINVKVKIDGPIGVVHLGDPHIDDPGTDMELLEKNIEIINSDPAIFGACVGDLQNNWLWGRLVALHGQQSTTAAEAWVLVEWLVNSIDWLYIVGGNHDAWSGAGDPLNWITRTQVGVFEYHGARLNLQFPNGKAVRVNCRHDWPGHSQWNTSHGLSKAVMMGWRDHIVTAGHKHVSGYQILKDPSTGLISHAIRVASFKTHDRYAKEKGLMDQAISPSVMTVIDPTREDTDPGLVSVFHDLEQGAKFLKCIRENQS